MIRRDICRGIFFIPKSFNFIKGTLYDFINVYGCTVETKPIYVYMRCTDSAVKLILSYTFSLTEI